MTLYPSAAARVPPPEIARTTSMSFDWPERELSLTR